jgi:hypothetical protein
VILRRNNQARTVAGFMHNASAASVTVNNFGNMT